MPDRRIIKTEQQIADVFLAALADHPLSKISVAAITRSANINRGTFYLHYKDVFDLYSKVSQEFIADLERVFDETYPDDEVPTAFVTLTNKILNYIQTNEYAFKILLQADNNAEFIEQIRNLFIRKIIEKEKIPESNQDYIIDVIYNVNGAIGVITAWEKGDLNCDIETITERLATIFGIL